VSEGLENVLVGWILNQDSGDQRPLA